MKTIKLMALFVLFASAFLLYSCIDLPKNLKTIPSHANLVSLIDIQSIAKKGQLSKILEFKLFKQLRSEAKREVGAIYKTFDEHYRNNIDSGINFKSNLLFYVLENTERGDFACLSLELNNHEKFSELVTQILTKIPKEYQIVAGGNYNYINLRNKLGIAWDKEKAVIISPQGYSGKKNLEQELKSQLNLSKQEQLIHKGSNFEEFYTKKYDIGLWIPPEEVKGNKTLKKLRKLFQKKLSDNALAIFLQFNKDDISLIAQILSNDKSQKDKIKPIFNKEFNKELLRLIPNKNLFTTTFSIDPIALHESINKSIDTGISVSDISHTLGINSKELLESFGGSFVLNLGNLKKYDKEYKSERGNNFIPLAGLYKMSAYDFLPTVSLIFDIKNNKFIKGLVDKAREREEEGFVEHENYYEFLFDNITSIYIGFNDKEAIITSDKETILRFVNHEYMNTNSALINTSMTHSAYAHLDLNYENYPKDLKTSKKGKKSRQLFIALWKKHLKSLELKLIGKDAIEIRLNLKNTEQGSLYTLLSMIDKG